jgi:hypothetical protein
MYFAADVPVKLSPIAMIVTHLHADVALELHGIFAGLAKTHSLDNNVLGKLKADPPVTHNIFAATPERVVVAVEGTLRLPKAASRIFRVYPVVRIDWSSTLWMDPAFARTCLVGVELNMRYIPSLGVVDRHWGTTNAPRITRHDDGSQCNDRTDVHDGEERIS